MLTDLVLKKTNYVCSKTVVREVFGSKRDAVSLQFRILNREEICDL
jgi:hypothetical protein